ncbi:hypothetical protein IW262DRAFT_1295987 [Armillaria fumosa]|nr:hypothetical protein IW262DRAFT_1295987 [Armillaria fumosa]
MSVLWTALFLIHHNVGGYLCDEFLSVGSQVHLSLMMSRLLRREIVEPEIKQAAASTRRVDVRRPLLRPPTNWIRLSAAPDEQEAWKALPGLFEANSRDELVTLLGFSKADIATRVAEAVEKLKVAKQSSDEEIETEEDDSELKPPESVVSFAEEHTFHVASDDEPFGGTVEKTPSEISADATSEGIRLADMESTTTGPSLFGDDGPGPPQRDVAVADFFSSIPSGESVPPLTCLTRTTGSTLTSETSKSNTFKIYSADESETDRLVTKALVLGDFEFAVSCLSSARFADAILLAARGGPELLQQTQNTYFDRRTSTYPYLQLFQSIVTNDLSHIVQNVVDL